jgi:hypothetical protein
VAARANCHICVALLLSKNADYEKKNRLGLSPRDLMKEKCLEYLNVFITAVCGPFSLAFFFFLLIAFGFLFGSFLSFLNFVGILAHLQGLPRLKVLVPEVVQLFVEDRLKVRAFLLPFSFSPFCFVLFCLNYRLNCRICSRKSARETLTSTSWARLLA